MPTTIERVVYTYDELSDKAKARARQDYVERGGHIPYEWWDASYDVFVDISQMLGISIETNNISFSGFSSQGDGASFTGSYRAEPAAIAKIIEYAPQDKELLRIATELTTIQVGMKLQHGGTFHCSISRTSSGYCHSNTMETCDQMVIGRGSNHPQGNSDYFIEADEENIDALVQTLMRDFADWMYRYLESEYDGYHDNDYLGEQLQEHQFDEDGSII